jgi:hypothetical protein
MLHVVPQGGAVAALAARAMAATLDATGQSPGEPFEEGPAEAAFWYRLDDPPALGGLRDPSDVLRLPRVTSA